MLKLISRVAPAAMVAALLGSNALVAQAEAPKAVVRGTGSFTSFVEDMDRSLAFYHDAFGMDVPELPASGQRPYNRPNPQLFKFFDIPGAKERHQSARIPDSRITVEIMEIQQVPHKTIPLRIQDPGDAAIVFLVRDLDAALARATKAKATVATPGGKPVMLADGMRSVLIRDIDGRFIELREPEPPREDADPAVQNIMDMRLLLTVNDMDKTLHAYRDVLGFRVAGETGFTADAGMRKLTGLANAEVRRSRIQAPGSTMWIELVEFKGVDRKPLQMKIQDRGAARLQLRVEDVNSTVEAAKAAGLRIDSEGGVGQPIPPNFMGALIADPNNFFLTAFAPCDNCAPTIGAPPAAH